MAISDVIDFQGLSDMVTDFLGTGKTQPTQTAMTYNPAQSMQFDTPQYQAPLDYGLTNPYTQGLTPAIPTAQDVTAPQSPTFMGMSMGNMFGGKDAMGNTTTGWLAPITGAATVGLGAYFGNQMMGMGEEAMAGQQAMMQENVANQKKMINTAMEDRQKARVAADPTAQPVDEYMAENAL